MLLDQLQTNYKQAMLARDTDSKEALNSVISAIKNKRIELQRDLDDTDMIQVLQKEIKLRREGAGFLLNANKQEQYDSEMKKITILEQFLPTMLDASALRTAVQKIIDTHTITDLAKQRGEVIKLIKAEHGASIDGKLLNEVIIQMIS
jgi:uncharacterized protein YqeY